MKFIVPLMLLGFLAACATPPFSKEMSPYPEQQLQEQEAFIAALDQFSATNKLELMATFPQRYPNSSMIPYAKTIRLYAQELEARKTQLSALQEDHQQLREQMETELQQLQEQLESAEQENLKLNEQIEQLKTLLIELENRSQ